MSSDKFLLIKAWSCTVWMDIDHVLGQLLIAELTNRIPVVYWSTHCLHNKTICTNAFELYFEPVSKYTISDLANPDFTYYPPIWDSDTLLVNDQNKDSWAYRNIGDIIGSSANVVIGDVYYNIYELIPFIKKKHPAYGMTAEQAYHYLFSKYIKVKPDIELLIQRFSRIMIKDNHPVLAVHVRKPDTDVIFDLRNPDKYKVKFRKKMYKQQPEKKPGISARIRSFLTRGRDKIPNELYHSEIRRYIEKFNIRKIFLLTDSQDVIDEYKKRYGTMLLYTECKRMSSESTASLENPIVKRTRGIEVILDTYLAANCDFFIGNDFSHLSHAVLRMKDWPDKNTVLLYWLHRKVKYPINSRLIVKKGKSIVERVVARVKKAINKYFRSSDDGGDNNAR